jgi:Mg/Co/Ni transporter MgtE
VAAEFDPTARESAADILRDIANDDEASDDERCQAATMLARIGPQARADAAQALRRLPVLVAATALAALGGEHRGVAIDMLREFSGTPLETARARQQVADLEELCPIDDFTKIVEDDAADSVDRRRAAQALNPDDASPVEVLRTLAGDPFEKAMVHSVIATFDHTEQEPAARELRELTGLSDEQRREIAVALAGLGPDHRQHARELLYDLVLTAVSPVERFRAERALARLVGAARITNPEHWLAQ